MMGSFLAALGVLAAAALPATVAPPAPLAPTLPQVVDLSGRPADLAPPRSRGVLAVLFWRADCGPCLLELSDLAALRRAAEPGRVVAVGLQEADLLRPALRKLGLRDADSLRSPADPARLLTAFGGAPPRLPLTVAFDGAGRVCGTHTGYLGRDQVRAWARSCEGAHAPG